jgi:hypothetical protein
MSTCLARSPIVAVTGVLTLLWLAASCLAASPIKGGRYAGQTSKGDFVAFNVDDRGRAFVSSPRLVFQGSEIDAPCSTSPWDLGGARRPDVSGKQTTLSNGTPVRVRADGTFALSAAASDGGARASLNLTGRFLGGGKQATASFQVSRSRCTKRGTLTARFTGQRHLTKGACPPSGTKSIINDGVRRVYEETYVYDQIVRNSDGGFGPGGAIYGCEGQSGEHWFLSGDDIPQALVSFYGCGEEFAGVAVSGDLAALSVGELCQDPGVVAAIGRIVNLHTGMVFREGVPTVGSFPPNPSDGSLITTGDVTPDGSAAWIVCTVFAQPQLCQVIDEVSNGPNTLLDQGAQIDPGSLVLRGFTVSWRNNGETKTATLA